jgi:large subunit ribosomal protein L4e
MSKKANVYDKSGSVVGEVTLPSVFETEVREEVIRRAVLSEESKLKQPKGSYRWAGLETSARYIGRKEAYATLKNRGQSRLPREFFGGGRPGRVRYIPSAVSGRRAHPPKPEKILEEKINKKEWDLALRSALAATTLKDLVLERGHRVSVDVPIVLKDAESVNKTSDIFKVLEKIIGEDLERAKQKRGKNKKYPKSAVIVVSGDVPLLKAAKNIPGVDVVKVEELKVSLLAPGTHPGRLAVYTEEAIKAIGERWKL